MCALPIRADSVLKYALHTMLFLREYSNGAGVNMCMFNLHLISFGNIPSTINIIFLEHFTITIYNVEFVKINYMVVKVYII